MCHLFITSRPIRHLNGCRDKLTSQARVGVLKQDALPREPVYVGRGLAMIIVAAEMISPKGVNDKKNHLHVIYPPLTLFPADISSCDHD